MAEGKVVIKVTELKKYFELKKGFLSFGEAPKIKAVDDVNFDLREGEILGLVGESGCGKTTVGRLLTRLEDPTGGYVFFLGRDVALLEGEDVKVFRRNIQMVFQDPYESLNPRTTVLQTVMEPLVNHRIGEGLEDRTERAIRALEDAGLAPAKEYLNRFPHELSGGQRQRVSIARALVIHPKVIVADEPVSMLDVSIRAGVLNLMLDLRDKYGIPYLFITHDIAVARYVSDRLGVMYLGRVVELGETDKVVFEPKHPYTQALLSAVPVPDPDAKHGRIKIKGEIPSAANVPVGCRFRPRCPKAFKDCGWQGEDLAEWLMDEDKAGEEGHPLKGPVREMRPEGFTLELRLAEGADHETVKGYMAAKVASLKESNPMFQAVEAVEAIAGDREIRVRCRSVGLTGEEVAKEMHSMLARSVQYDEEDHPMHGMITEMRVDGSDVLVSVGSGIEGATELTVAFLRDFVKHYRHRGYGQLKGVREVASDKASRTVRVRCASAKEPSRMVAAKLAETIEERFPAKAGKGLGRMLLPVSVKGSRVGVRVMGPEENWDRAVEVMRDLLAEAATAGNRVAKGVSGVEVARTKGTETVVVVKFIRRDEPPLLDVGGGHQVACYLLSPVP